MPAVPIIAAAAAVGGTAVAIDANRRASNAAGDASRQAENLANSGVAMQANDQNARLQQYFVSDPAFQAEYSRVVSAGDTRSPTEWLAGHIEANPSEAQKFNEYTQTRLAEGTGVIPSTAMGPGGVTDVNLLQQQAQAVARQNAANSAALEAQYNPGAAELRAGSLQALMAGLQPNQQLTALQGQIASQAGQPLNVLPAAQYDSALTRAAVAKAQQDLALGGQLPAEVRNLIARKALAQSGTVTGGLGLGRDLTARDLGLTSLQIEQARLNNAFAGGNAEAALESGNAALRQNYNAQRLAADQYARDNLLSSGNFLAGIQSGNFAQALAAAQLGQSIQQPMSGLDPGSVANVAIGNSNLATGAQQQASGLQASAANARMGLGSSLVGAGLGLVNTFYRPTPAAGTTYTGAGGAPAASGLTSQPYFFCWVAREVYGADNPAWTEFRDKMLASFPKEFVEFYRQNGEAIAADIADKPMLKQLIRGLMDHARGVA